MEVPKIVQELLDKKAEMSNTVDLDAYANGLLDMYQALQLQQTGVMPSAFVKQFKNTNMSKFRKKPVEIEAVKFTRNNWDEVKSFTNDTAHTLTIEKRINGIATCIIPTLEGQHIATEGDWIIKGVKGEFYPCKPDIFDATYESVY